MFSGYERGSVASASLYEGLIYQSPDLPDFADLRDMAVSPNEPDPLGGGDETATLHEAQASYFSMFEPKAKPRTFLSILADVGYENDLPTSWRIAAIAAIMLIGIIGFAVLVNVVEGLSRLY